jgi:hypothetical protein
MCKKLKYFQILSAVVLFFVFFGINTTILAQSVYINEVMSSNSDTIEDDDGDTSDWIELYNTGTETVNLTGYGLSDSYDQPFRWVFPPIAIQPGEFMIIWASGKDRTNPNNPLHTNFSIAAEGEEVILTSPDSIRIDELQPVEIPTDFSVGRQPDGTGDWHFFTSPTPGTSNINQGYSDILEPVTFSHTGGFYVNSFGLYLSHPDDGVNIVYTHDGSEPDPNNFEGTTFQYKNQYRESNSNQTDGPLLNATYQSYLFTDSDLIMISDRTSQPNVFSRISSTYHQNPYYFPSHQLFKGTVIRAKAVKAGSFPSQTSTHTYFVTPQGDARYSLPVISISIQGDYYFNYNKGTYVAGIDFDTWRNNNPSAGADGATPANYRRRGIEWEYPASIEFYEPGTNGAAIRQVAGVRMHGGWGRANAMKSIRLYARGEYGETRFNHRMFPDLPYTQYNRLLLRNSGNDWIYTMFRDALVQRIVDHMNFDTQAYRPCIVFVNGEYWGIHNLRERYDRHYLSRVYGVDPDRVDILDGNASVIEGSNEHYVQTIQYITQNSSMTDEDYEYVKTRIDVDNFMDYQIAQIFAGNRDWPGNNIDYWRYQADGYQPDAPYGHDGRWRWLMYDTEFSFGIYGVGADHNTLALATATNGSSWPNPPWSTLLLRRLLNNQTFRNQFINRFADQMNTAFRPERIRHVIDEMADVLRPEILEHVQRWKQPGSVDSWNSQVEVMRQFASARTTEVRRHIRNYFNITALESLTVASSDPTAGKLYVNSIELSPSTTGIDPDPLPWTGVYFQNIPVTVRAEPVRGYRFSHWEGIAGTPVTPEIYLPMSATTSVTAVFEVDPEAEFMPEAYDFSDGSYVFESWAADAPAGTFPAHMAFVYMDEADPGLDSQIEDFTNGVYNLDSRTRINGLGDDGFAFINTSNEDGNPGYPGVRLGGAILALNTLGRKDIDVEWEGKTILPNSRVYNIRLQYRIGDEGLFKDVLDQGGNPVEYLRNPDEGHTQQLSPVRLPAEVDNKVYIQLLWRYYYTGVELDPESGQRSQLAVSRIIAAATGEVVGVSGESNDAIPEKYLLHQNYPNPFNPSTQIRFELPEANNVRLAVYDILGREVELLVDERLNPGVHTVNLDASNLSGGVYIYRLRTENFVQSKRMLYVK